MEEGERTLPFSTDDGLIILQLNSKDAFSPLENYTSFSTQLLQANKLASPLKLDKAIKKISQKNQFPTN